MIFGVRERPLHTMSPLELCLLGCFRLLTSRQAFISTLNPPHGPVTNSLLESCTLFPVPLFVISASPKSYQAVKLGPNSHIRRYEEFVDDFLHVTGLHIGCCLGWCGERFDPGIEVEIISEFFEEIADIGDMR